MILQSLRDLALREHLVGEPAFESKGVMWSVKIDKAGKFLRLEQNLPDIAPDKGKKKPTMMSIPRRCVRSGTKIRADFLCDKAEYVFGVLPDGAPAAKDATKPERCRQAFLTQMETAATKSASSLLHAVALFLESDEQRTACLAKLRSEKSWVSNDLFAFSSEGQLLHDDPAIRAWWSTQQQESTAEGTSRQCLLCGKESVPVDNHDKLNIPGATTSGVPLVSFNMDAFLKYGLDGNDNAPICRACMTAYVEGLRRCLNERYPDPNTGTMMGRQSVRLSPDTVAVYWTDCPWQLAPSLSLLFDHPEDLENVLRSPHAGTNPGKLDGMFYCIILSGAQGRAMLRSTHTGTVEHVEHSIHKYFDALQLPNIVRPMPLRRLLQALEPPGRNRSLPPELAAEIFLAALFALPMPRLILSAAVARNRAEQQVSSSRAALLQLYFSSHPMEEFKMPLDPACSAPAYRLGRLFAVLEKLQYSALGKINATIVDRFYGAASTRPGTVFPQLLKLAQSHVKKSSAGGYFQSRMGEIITGLGVAFPAMLSLEEQGQFALGFYHEKWTRTDKDASGLTQDEESTEKEEGATA